LAYGPWLATAGDGWRLVSGGTSGAADGSNSSGGRLCSSRGSPALRLHTARPVGFHYPTPRAEWAFRRSASSARSWVLHGVQGAEGRSEPLVAHGGSGYAPGVTARGMATTSLLPRDILEGGPPRRGRRRQSTRAQRRRICDPSPRADRITEAGCLRAVRGCTTGDRPTRRRCAIGPAFVGVSRTGRRKACGRLFGSASPCPHRGARTARQRRPQLLSSFFCFPSTLLSRLLLPLAAAAGPAALDDTKTGRKRPARMPARRGTDGATDGSPAGPSCSDSSLERVPKCGRVSMLPGGDVVASGRRRGG
jgi:hypothetical protein